MSNRDPMDSAIKLDNNLSADIRHLKGQNAFARGLNINGKGTLFVCMVAFYNENEVMAQHQELYFHKPEYMSAKQVPARKSDFSISKYDYCSVKILTGSLSPGDEILLSYEIPAP